MEILEEMSGLLFVMAALVFTVNMTVEVLKKVFRKIPATLLTLLLSVGMTVAAFFAWTARADVTVCWYHVAAAGVLGIFVAYAAMFGFDKFKEALWKLKACQKGQ